MWCLLFTHTLSVIGHAWMVAWCPHPGRFDLRVRGTRHNDLAHVGVYDDDGMVDAEPATSTSEASLNFRVLCPDVNVFYSQPSPSAQLAAREFGCLLLIPPERSLECSSNEIMIPVIAPASVMLHAELSLVSSAPPNSVPSAGTRGDRGSRTEDSNEPGMCIKACCIVDIL